MFLGRLVATLPGDEAQPGAFVGPCPPQAVVECNFWQLRGDVGANASAVAGVDTNISPGPEIAVSGDRRWPPAPQQGFVVQGVSADMASWKELEVDDGLCLAEPWPLCSDDDNILDKLGNDFDDDNLPPWPHEM